MNLCGEFFVSQHHVGWIAMKFATDIHAPLDHTKKGWKMNDLPRCLCSAFMKPHYN